jgi:murein DD-endopeptidase MepM/ murein hydrolase activator NlpD
MLRLSCKWVVILLAIALPLNFKSAFAQEAANAPAEIRIPVSPTPVNAHGRVVLAYEIHMTNFQAGEITLKRVEVFGDTPNETIASLKDDSLLAALFRPGAPTVADKRVMSGGTRAIVYMWFTLDPARARPKSGHHRFLFSIARADGKSEERDVDAARFEISPQGPVVISPPVKQGTWLAAFGPSSSSTHRRALLPAFGHTGNSERFAVDWMKLGDDGKLFHGDAKVNANWYGYGTEVLSVGDAVVTAVKDGIPENVPFSPERAVPITLDTLGGNHVILSLGASKFALYAHLQPGSIRVKVGQRVRRGQVLALLGNSGNSVGPHLHFHISNENSPRQSEGLPFVLDSFTLLDTAKDLREVIERGWNAPVPPKPEKRHREMPLENEVVEFD